MAFNPAGYNDADIRPAGKTPHIPSLRPTPKAAVPAKGEKEKRSTAFVAFQPFHRLRRCGCPAGWGLRTPGATTMPTTSGKDSCCHSNSRSIRSRSAGNRANAHKFNSGEPNEPSGKRFVDSVLSVVSPNGRICWSSGFSREMPPKGGTPAQTININLRETLH